MSSVENDALFGHSLISVMFVTVLSEVGDETFFIAAILAMRHSRFSMFLGSFCGEVIMSIVSGMQSNDVVVFLFYNMLYNFAVAISVVRCFLLSNFSCNVFSA